VRGDGWASEEWVVVERMERGRGGHRMSAPELMMAASARARCRKRRCASRFCSRRLSSWSCRSSCSRRSSDMVEGASPAEGAAPSAVRSQDGEGRGDEAVCWLSHDAADGAGEHRRELHCELVEDCDADASWLLRLLLQLRLRVVSECAESPEKILLHSMVLMSRRQIDRKPASCAVDIS
jgi:hypothetical protein